MPQENSPDLASKVQQHEAVTCIFCSLLCDDLTTETRGHQVRALAQACPKAERAYAASVPASTPLIDGKPASFDAALAAASRILKRSRQPLFGGLATDVDGMRAALALAERCGAIVDHLHGTALARGVRVLQSRGQATTTLAEVRNRADLVLLLGVDLNTDFHRFVDVCLQPAESLHPERLAARRIVHLGPKASRPRHAGLVTEHLACTDVELPALVNALRVALKGGKPTLTGKRGKAVAQLADTIRGAAYTVLVWAPGQLPDHAGDLLISSAGELIAELNRTQRAAGLALGGNDGGQTALASCTWTTGFPLQLSFAGDTLDFDPTRYQTARLLAAGEVDALLWVSCFGDRRPPDTRLPCVVVGTAGSAISRAGSVYLPAGTPGIDHAGQLMRTDAVVVLPLQALRQTAARPAAAVLSALAGQLD